MYQTYLFFSKLSILLTLNLTRYLLMVGMIQGTLTSCHIQILKLLYHQDAMQLLTRTLTKGIRLLSTLENIENQGGNENLITINGH